MLPLLIADTDTMRRHTLATDTRAAIADTIYR